MPAANRAAIVVFGNLLVLRELLDVLVRIAADISNRDTMFFGYAVELLDQFLAAFLRQRRDRDTNHFPVVRRVHAEVSNANRLFDGSDLRRVPGSDGDHPRFGNVQVRDLIHRYANRTALNGVSFEVRPAELFGLLGPNGSGKTTLFRILSTLMVPTSGTATIAGLDAVREPGALRRRIGVVFQAQSVDEKLTAYENLWHQGHLYGLHGSSLKSRIKEILDRVGLADRANELVVARRCACKQEHA